MAASEAVRAKNDEDTGVESESETEEEKQPRANENTQRGAVEKSGACARESKGGEENISHDDTSARAEKCRTCKMSHWAPDFSMFHVTASGDTGVLFLLPGPSVVIVLLTSTDEDLQKLGKPPMHSGKEDEWSEWSFVMRSYVSLLSAHVPALLAGAEDTTNPDMIMTRTRATLTEDGETAAKKFFHVLVMNVRGPALALIRGITDMNGALAWRTLITRYAPNTAPRAQSLMSAILNVKTFPSEPTACEIALDER